MPAVTSTSTSTSTKRIGKTSFTPPPVEVGDDVMHYPDLETNEGGLCIVMQVHGRCLSIMNLHTRRAYNGVRHRNDPDLLTHPHLVTEHGCWDVAPKMKRLSALETKVEYLSARVKDLEARK